MIKNKKTIQIIILLVIAVILAIILCVLHIIDTLEKNEIINYITTDTKEDIQNNPKDYRIEEILESYECKVISYSVKADKENRY